MLYNVTYKFAHMCNIRTNFNPTISNLKRQHNNVLLD
jgi:hypothetical protein